MSGGTDINIDINVALKPFQRRILELGRDYSRRYLVVMANRQCGKSFIMRLLAFLYLTEKKKRSVGYVTLTQRLGRQFYGEMMKLIPPGIVAAANSQELTIELLNGSKMMFWSIENIEVVRGFTLTHLLVDEVAFARERTADGQDIWKNILSPLLDVRGCKCIFASTPFLREGLFYEAYSKATAGERGWDIVVKTVYDEMAECGVTDEWIAEKRATIGDTAFSMEYECRFREVNEVSFFKNYADAFDAPGTAIKALTTRVWLGIDFSSVGEDATVITRITDAGLVTQQVIDGSLDDKYAAIAAAINNEPLLVRCLYETNSIGEVMANSIRKLLSPAARSKFIGAATTSRSKPDMVRGLELAFDRHELHIPITESRLRSELGTFVQTVNPNTKSVSYAALPGHHDDCVMSLMIALYNKQKNAGMASSPVMVCRR